MEIATTIKDHAQLGIVSVLGGYDLAKTKAGRDSAVQLEQQRYTEPEQRSIRSFFFSSLWPSRRLFYPDTKRRERA